jgi:UDP-N-acetylmuramyl pentapeptide phosphotransferase/UDP-N-acetylglucosamine-1-phosphate transferase
LGEEGLGEPRLAVIAGTAAFGLVGLLDDLATPSGARGFKGHLGALTRGRLTTGAAKLAGGGAAALIVVGLLEPESGLDSLLRDALLIALAANLVNLFDRAPGRALKAVGASFVVIVVALGAASVLAPAAVAVGAGLALLLDDLHERVMLGDTGANALGAALGIAAVVGLSATGRTVVAVALVVLNGLSEVVSFGRVIDGFAPLRAVDRAGRRP